MKKWKENARKKMEEKNRNSKSGRRGKFRSSGERWEAEEKKRKNEGGKEKRGERARERVREREREQLLPRVGSHLEKSLNFL